MPSKQNIGLNIKFRFEKKERNKKEQKKKKKTNIKEN